MHHPPFQYRFEDELLKLMAFREEMIAVRTARKHLKIGWHYLFPAVGAEASVDQKNFFIFVSIFHYYQPLTPCKKHKEALFYVLDIR